MTDKKLAKDLLLKGKLFYFVQQVFRTVKPGEDLKTGEYLEALCFLIETLSKQKGSRTVINLPPRMLKSITVSVALAAWYLGHDPSKSILVATYNDSLSEELGRMFQQVIESAWYKRLFPLMKVDSRRNTAKEVKTTMGGGRKGISVDGTATGFGADMIIIDDISKAGDVSSEVERQRRKDFYDQTLFSRMNNPKEGIVISIQQRLHEDDICGHLISKNNFKHYIMRAIAEENETWYLYSNRKWERKIGDPLCSEIMTTEDYRKLEQEMNPYEFATQYQQTCTAKGGNNIRWEGIQFYDQAPPRHMLLRVAQSWDTAVTATKDSDYSVCTTWGYGVDKKWYLLDVYRARHEFPELEDAAKHLMKQWQPDGIAIEAQGAGLPLATKLKQYLRPAGTRSSRKDKRISIDCFNPRECKENRFHLHKYKLEQGKFLLPRKAVWLADFRHELLTFPAGRHDDQVDSVTQFLYWLESYPVAKRMMDIEPRKRVGR